MSVGKLTAAPRWLDGWDPRQVALTPAHVLDAVRASFGGTIGLDPCTQPNNPTAAAVYWTLADDGLQQDWRGHDRIYVNPPFGASFPPWASRCLEAGQAGARVILLSPAITETRIGQALLAGSDAVMFPAGRLRMGRLRPDNGRPASFPGPMMLALWGVSLAPYLPGVELARR